MKCSPAAIPASPWLNSLDGAVLVRCLTRDTGEPSREAFLAWAKRHGLIPVYRGRVPLFARRDVEAALNTSVVEAAHARRAAQPVAEWRRRRAAWMNDVDEGSATGSSSATADAGEAIRKGTR